MYPPLRFCLRYFTYATLFFIIVTALLLQGARLSAPYLFYFIPSIESFVSKKTQTQATIGGIDGYWYGLTPHIVLRDISLAQQYNGQPSSPHSSSSPLSIVYAELKLDLLASLLRQEWVWEKIAIRDVKVTVVQDESTGWSVAGFSMSGDDDLKWRYQHPIHILRRMPDVDIGNITLQLMFSDDDAVTVDIPSIKTETDNAQGFQRLSAEFTLDDEPILSIVLEDKSNVVITEPSDQRPSSEAYSVGFVSITQLPLHFLTHLSSLQLASSTQWLQQGLQHEKVSQKSSLNGEFWFDFSHASEVSFQAKATTQLDSTSFKHQEESFHIDLFVQGELDQYGNVSIALDDIVIDDQAALLDNVVFTKEGAQSRLRIKNVDAGLWSSWLQQRFLLLPKVRDVLTQLSPEGELSDIQVMFNQDDFSQSILSANIKGFSVQAFNKVPSVKNVSAYLESGLLSGFVNIASQDMQFFPNVIYDRPFVFDQVSGQVAWQVDYEKNSLIVNSNVIDGQAVFGEVVGAFLLDIPFGDENRKGELTLQLGLKNSDAKYHGHAIPNVVSSGLRSWLATSLRKGHIEQAGFVYRGGFSGANNTRSFQLFVNASETDLAYSNDWPMLKNVRGQVVVDNEYMQVTSTQASVFDEPLKDLSIIWSGDGDQQLHIQTSARLSATTGLRLLTETKLRDGVGSLFSGVSATENIEVDINLLISPKENYGSSKPVNDWQKIRVDFLGNTVSLPVAKLPSLNASSLKGALFYSTDKGLTANALDMILFGDQLSLSMQTTSHASSASQLSIKGSGVASVSELSSWIKRPEMASLSGILPYQFTLTTPFSLESEGELVSKDSSIRLSAASTLQGLAVDLPAPFKKSRSLQRNITLDSIFSSDTTKHSVKIDEGIASELLITEQSASGFLSIGKSFSSPVADKVFVVSAVVDEVVLDEWVAFSDKFSAATKHSPEDNEISDMRFIYDVDIDVLSVNNQQFKDITIAGERAGGQWRSQFSHELAMGELTVHDDHSVPTNIALDYLRMPKKQSEDDQAVSNDDPLANVDLSWLKPTRVSIKRLIYGESDLGQWRLMVDPLAEGIQVNDIYATFSGMTLRGKTESQGAELFWRTMHDDSHPLSGESQFVGQLYGAGIQELFNTWDVSPLLTSKQTRLNADFSWSGSPAAFSIGAVRGGLDVQLNDGAFIQNTGVGSSGVLRLLGLFNFNTWARRLQLDFSDFYKKGVAYDELSTRFVFDEGNIYFEQPLVVKAPSSEFTMAGAIDYHNERIDTVLVTTLPVGGNLTFATALVAGLPAAVGVFVFNKVFKSQVDKASSLTYGIKGNWSEPEVKLINLFDNKLTNDDSTDLSTVETPELIIDLQ